MATVFIGLGSNLGEREENLERSIELLLSDLITGLVRSGIYNTEPVGFTADTPFLNMVVAGNTELTPTELLAQLLLIEKSMGRVRVGSGYQSRLIDLDLLFYDDIVLNTPELIIPHPLIQDRLFVLEPICDIAPDYVHPILKRTMRELRESLEK